MPFRLLSPALAAREWGWHEGMVFINRNHEEILRELLLYLNSKKSFRWKAQPYYALLRASRRTGALESAVKLCGQFPTNQNDKPFGHWVWYFDVISQPGEDLIIFDRQYLCSLTVPFKEDGSLREAKIEYMVEDGHDKGFYYITVYDWIARCSEPCECAALLNAIEPVALYENWIYRIREYSFFRYLEHIPCHNDPPRRATFNEPWRRW